MDPQSRIIAHMNKDHNLSLQDYLEVFGNKKLNSSISNVTMESFELNRMDIAYLEKSIKKSVKIPFSPPLKDFGEARLRLVEMAKEAAVKRGFSAFQIKDIIYPSQPLELILLSTMCLITIAPKVPFISYFVLESLLNISHETSTTLLAYSSVLAIVLLVIHALEFVLTLRPLLNKYRVPSSVRLQYFFMCLFEGIFLIKRFKKMVGKLENPTKDH